MVDRKEVREARAAAQEVLSLLDKVEATLRGALNWGILDLVASKSLIASVIKFGKIDKAEAQLKEVQKGLKRLQKELGDLELSMQDSLSISGLQRFVDIAFDNIISDWMTQSRINATLREVEYVRNEVKGVIDTLDLLDG
ncbi:MAG: hypothetical protein GX205_05705 [Firmicutes bacterium]|nr:hypothetical protein [Bacillota bacterium]